MLNPISLLEQILEVIWSFIEPNPLPGLKIVPTGRSITRLLSKRAKGFNLTGKLKLSPEDSFRGALIIGGTGTGKSRRCLIPSLESMQGSFVVHDPSGELLNATYASLVKRGYTVQVFNPTEPKHSCRFNYLDRVVDEAGCRIAATRIIETSYPDPNGLGFWELSAVSFLTMLLTALLKHEAKSLSLPNLYHFINAWGANPKEVENLFKSITDEQLWAEYMNFRNYDEKLLSGIVATAKGALGYMVDVNVQEATSESEAPERTERSESSMEHLRVSAKMLRAKPTAVFIQTNTTKAKDYIALLSLFFDKLFEDLMEVLPEHREQDVFLLLDEAGSLYIPSLPAAMANVRKYGVGILLALQDYAQLSAVYGKDNASAIRSNCYTQLSFSGAGLELSEYYSRLLGFADQRTSEGYSRRLPVLAVNELRELGRNQALLVCGNLRPYVLNMPRFKVVPTDVVKLKYEHGTRKVFDLTKVEHES